MNTGDVFVTLVFGTLLTSILFLVYPFIFRTRIKWILEKKTEDGSKQTIILSVPNTWPHYHSVLEQLKQDPLNQFRIVSCPPATDPYRRWEGY